MPSGTARRRLSTAWAGIRASVAVRLRACLEIVRHVGPGAARTKSGVASSFLAMNVGSAEAGGTGARRGAGTDVRLGRASLMPTTFAVRALVFLARGAAGFGVFEYRFSRAAR